MRKLVAPAVGFVLAFAVAALVLPGRVAAEQPVIGLISVNTRGAAGDGPSQGPSVSHDGLFVAFWSSATDLLQSPAPATNGLRNVYVRNVQIGVTELISVGTDGKAGNGNSPNGIAAPAISADGNFVAFSSAATNLVDDDPNGHIEDIFVRDRGAGVTQLISLAAGGGGADGPSSNPSISFDGRFVAFQSAATNLVAGVTPSKTNIYIWDRDSGDIHLVSIAFDGGDTDGDSKTPSISGDGRVVAFSSTATNLLASPLTGPQQVYVRLLDEGTTELVSLNNAGTPGNRSSFGPAADGDGGVIAFKSDATNLTNLGVPDTNGATDVFVRIRAGENSRTEIVSISNENVQSKENSEFPGIDASGNFVAFPNFDDFFDPNDGNHVSDVFVRDRANEKIARISVEMNGLSDGEVSIEPPSVSPEGQWIGFSDASTKLAPNTDENGTFDVFLACNPLMPPCPPGAATATATVTEVTPTATLPPTNTSTSTPIVTPTPSPTATPTGTNTSTPTVSTPTATGTRPSTPTFTVAGLSTATPTSTPIHCDTQGECPDDLVCINNMCVPPPPCETTQNCPDDLVCIDGKCLPCRSNSDCPNGGTCVDGVCVGATPTPTPPQKSGGGGGGCSCEIDPAQRADNVFEGLSLMAPAVALWAVRRRRKSRV